MKIKPKHYATLEYELNAVLRKYPNLVDEYENGLFPRSDKVKDLQRRFCFDVLFGAGMGSWICKELYPYMNDEHVYTALKRILPTLTRRYK